MPRDQHQLPYPLGRRGRHARRDQRAVRPFGASFLVAGALDVIDGIVEPQRHLDLLGTLCQIAHLLEQRQAFLEVLLRVVVTLRFGIAGEQLIAQRDAVRVAGPGADQGGPRAPPGAFEESVHVGAMVATPAA